MRIHEYIRDEIFLRRAKENSILVIYDPSKLYHDIAVDMKSEQCLVIDASSSIIESRESSTAALKDLTSGRLHQIVIWVPTTAPADADGKQTDPFAVFGDMGSTFPHGDGDDFASICRKAKPDHIPELNRLFDQGCPTFDEIDALDQGGSWPRLKTILSVDSSKEILTALLSPDVDQLADLNKDTNWSSEAREFVERILGHILITKDDSYSAVSTELWRLVLFSEFVFDTTEALPVALGTIPRAGVESTVIIYEVCDHLRKHSDFQDTYREIAKNVQAELNLEQLAGEMINLGERDTFPFEERVYLQRVVESTLKGDIDEAKRIIEIRKESIWRACEDRLAQWCLADRAVSLIEAAQTYTIGEYSDLESIISHYSLNLRDLDRYHREMEQSVNEWHGTHGGLTSLIDRARHDYFKSVELLHTKFICLVERDGWPASGSGLISNCQLFNKIVSPIIDKGERVAYFLVDSLRYELGVEVEKQLSDKLRVNLQAVCAQLPTYTEVGMASLMPDAEFALKLIPKKEKLATTLGGQSATKPSERFDYLKSLKGDQCKDIELEKILRQKTVKIAETVKILLVRTRDIDTLAHGSPHQVLEQIPRLLAQIIKGVHKAADLGFDKVVIATDHGFLLFPSQEAGNVSPTPKGNWLIKKSRCVLGSGEKDSANLIVKREEMGIPGDFEHYGTPRALVPYSRGELYYHEGLSLQECVLPCLTVELKPKNKKVTSAIPITLTLSYRQGKTDRITSRRPVVDLAWPSDEFVFEQNSVEVSIEAVDRKGKVVGWVSSGQSMNPATGGVQIRQREALSVALRMEDDFSGEFTVRVLAPISNAMLASLDLKTEYFE